jgi:hypothetical protein
VQFEALAQAGRAPARASYRSDQATLRSFLESPGRGMWRS